MTDTRRTAILTDQKLLNEELVASIAEVALINVQHCADLFEIPRSLALRIKGLHVNGDFSPTHRDVLLDLATTPAPLWRISLSSNDLRQMTSVQSPMFASELEPYRPIVARLNRLVVGMLVRYANDPILAALVCGVTNVSLLHAVQEAACVTLLDCAGNPGRPLLEARITHAMLDRFFITCDGEPADPTLCALVATTTVCESEFSVLERDAEAEAEALRLASPFHPAPLKPKRSGKAPSILLNPEDGQLVVKMLAYRVKPSDIERCLPDRGVRTLQIERLQSELFPKTKDVRDAQQIWASATRRLQATSVLLKQRALIALGLMPLHALVEAFDFHVKYQAPDAMLSLPRLLKDVFAPSQGSQDVRFKHCPDCATVHLSNEHKLGSLECPVCCLVYRKKLGHKRRWKNYLESTDFSEGLPLAA
jgi:hypothetical protein